ncbi:MAG: erythrose-4-phosphate dehydrogenase [Zoogloeaceae bacterium]|jgi:glyceraldehyde 3-phosphate dehydrogenase/D-erythrose 4-phosphate dehydrogenase|nr:erythrose-4-phosphate dehydrogenase [Zoogloeaceae bacterium]
MTLPPSRPFRLAINGYGRIGRCFVRALKERGMEKEFQIVALNDPADLESMVYLTRFDSTHGRFPGKIDKAENALILDGTRVRVTHAREPEALHWSALEIDLLVECSGQYGERADLSRFLAAGAPRLLLSQPGASAADVDATLVYGFNHATLRGAERLVSAASCTTNAAVPTLSALLETWGEAAIDQAILTTLHSVMNDQPLIDGYHHADLRRTRSAMQSVIPVSTGLARGVERLLPCLSGKIAAKAIRVPTTNVSALDVMIILNPARVPRNLTAETINQIFSARANSDDRIAYTETPHASIDFSHLPHSVIVDGSQTRVMGHGLVNLFLWFDNEWGFVNRMLDITRHWLTLETAASL